MRDLKHLIYFEDLLQEANNDLVRKGKEDGNLCLGYTCYFMPEVLLDLPGCFSVRLRAPKCTSPDMASYYMSGRTCHYGRSLLERALEGGYNFIDAQLATETCTVMDDVINNSTFKTEFTDVPFKKNENSIDHYRKQLKLHVLDFLEREYGVDTSDEAILKAIEINNEVNDIITEIGNFRKLDNPTITGYEFSVITLVSMVCPKYLIVDKLRETLEELRTREPDDKPNYKIKVLLAGSENDDPDFIKLIEGCGALVVADRYCYGSLEARNHINIEEGDDPLTAVAKHYLLTSQCARFMEQKEMRNRKKVIADYAKEYKADGIIVASNKFCEYWSYERMIDTIILPRDYGFPVCSIEKEYINTASGQLRTRFQAFVESVELKKIQEVK